MCLGDLFGGKPKTPSMPSVPPTASPPPMPSQTETGTQAQDMNAKKKKQMRAGLLSTIKSSSFSPFASAGGEKNTLG